MNTVFIVTLDMIRSVTAAALCIMLSQLWWTQKCSVKKNTKSLLWSSNVQCLVCQIHQNLTTQAATLFSQSVTGHSNHCPPPTSPVCITEGDHKYQHPYSSTRKIYFYPLTNRSRNRSGGYQLFQKSFALNVTTAKFP